MKNDSTCKLHSKTCVPCRADTPRLTWTQAESLLAQVKWTLIEPVSGGIVRLERSFSFRDFKEALAFVNRVGEIAEAEDHHPDILLHNWKRVKLTLATHAIGGLSENDFIVAAKIDALCAEGERP